ncbi:ABC transporter substrate-binding protein [Paenibacillus fonticola]|uniref:ABC transporter substrate-binding protein n=1 Tax=Paenibacillus fonticola TaxID=379896 RepID=UPI0003778E8E|nr:cobalamin-binding protein [Paenibacillus fonticola]
MNKFRKFWGIWLLAIMLVVMAGCGKDAASTNNGNTPAQQEQNAQTGQEEQTDSSSDAQRTVYPLTVKDVTGAEFTFEAAPQRIVSLAPSETEGIFALGLDEHIVGVSDVDDYPEAVKDKPRMGGFQVNVEAVIAAKPDLVLAGNLIAPATVENLTDLGIQVYRSNPTNLDETLAHIRTVGEITDRQKEAEEVVTQMEKERDIVLDAVKSLTPDQKKKVYIEFSPGWTVGKGVFMDELITLAGGVNVASDLEGWNEINEENIIKANPDVILFAKNVVDENNKTIGDMIKARGGWDQITAVKEDRVVGMDDNLLSRPGPRVTQGLIEMARAIYPELIQQ